MELCAVVAAILTLALYGALRLVDVTLDAVFSLFTKDDDE